jgi:hypothetical protein
MHWVSSGASACFKSPDGSGAVISSAIHYFFFARGEIGTGPVSTL